jgi:methyl-accepting chemotaxis protein
VQDTAVSLNTIVEGARQVSDQISQIAVVSNEQSEALEQLVEGINVISRLVETNVSVSENCASVASTFNSQAQMLKDLVAHYKLK